MGRPGSVISRIRVVREAADLHAIQRPNARTTGSWTSRMKDRVHATLNMSLTEPASSSIGARMLFLPVSRRSFLARRASSFAPRVSRRKRISRTRRTPFRIM